MFWTAVWFIVNIIFVISFILFLFRQRAFSLAKMEGAEEEKLRKLHRWSKLSGAASILLFLATTVIFLVNMKVNG
ncbi:hypothetical protein ACFSTH_04990 [Paenibacillus yanchengensis]|uniref:DUF3899 domain-containing protein n=1 Tax=Paenibacillus yanchengensis TaxID=2035833 RepID=A0ABW4YKJ1_9BACL